MAPPLGLDRITHVFAFTRIKASAATARVWRHNQWDSSSTSCTVSRMSHHVILHRQNRRRNRPETSARWSHHDSPPDTGAHPPVCPKAASTHPFPSPATKARPLSSQHLGQRHRPRPRVNKTPCAGSKRHSDQASSPTPPETISSTRKTSAAHLARRRCAPPSALEDSPKHDRARLGLVGDPLALQDHRKPKRFCSFRRLFRRYRP